MCGGLSGEGKIEALLGRDQCGIKIQRDILHFDSRIPDRAATRGIVSERQTPTERTQRNNFTNAKIDLSISISFSALQSHQIV